MHNSQDDACQTNIVVNTCSIFFIQISKDTYVSYIYFQTYIAKKMFEIFNNCTLDFHQKYFSLMIIGVTK